MKLLVLALAAMAAAMSTAAPMKCPSKFPWEGCFCDSQVQPSQAPSWETYCSPNFEDPIFMLHASSQTTFRIECHESHPFIPHLLQELNLTKVSTIAIAYCPLPAENLTFSDIFSTNITTLTFEQMKGESPVSLLLQQVRSLSQLLHLDLKKNRIASFPSDYFKSLPSMSDLELHENSLVSIPQELFAPLANLTSLQLGSNKIESISELAFINNTLLKRLHLYNNQIANLSELIFYELRALELLDISYNYLETLAPSLFSKNVNLKILSLKGNRLKAIPPAIFNHNSRLESLDLSHNTMLDSLPESLFEQLKLLETLNLEDCEIRRLASRLLHSCYSLQVLSLRDNNLTSLPQDFLEVNSKLRKVDLSFNKISDLPEEVFKGKHNLKELFLAKNNLQDLPPSLFDHTTSLERLNMASNQLAIIPAPLFQNLRQLKYLDLQENQISAFESKYISFSSSLRTVNLTSNKLSTIDNLEWSIFVNLERVEIEWNAISELSVPVMMSHPYIYLRHNNISKVSAADINLQDQLTASISSPKDPIPLASSIFLRYNPLNCDCHLYDFYAYYKEEGKLFKSTSFPDFDVLTCREPMAKKDKLLTKLSKDEFICPKEEECPDSCTCSMRASDKAILVDCQGLQMIQGPKMAPFNASILNLRNNKIENLQFLNLPIWQNLTHLYLDNNSIVSVSEWKIVPRKLRVLSLTNNLLSNVPESFLKLVTSQSALHLYLGANPWNCTCALRPFKVWITEYHKRVEDLENVYCSLPVMQNGTEVRSLVAQVTDSDICPVALASHLVLIIALSVALSLVAFLLFLISVLYYRNKNVIIAYIFIHFNNIFLCFFKESDLDEDKVYDAFVSYSSTDTTLARELISELEEKAPYFKLCVHERDWLPGHMISWNIANSVQNSRKTILVLSRAFLESMWFQVEFRTAYYQMLEDRIDRLIVIIKGELPPKENLDKDLQFLLSTKTYLVYGEKWFWEKLRYAMPHKKVLENPEVKAFNAKPKPAILSTVEQQMSNFFAITNGDINKSPPVPPKRRNKAKAIAANEHALTPLPKESCGEFVNQNFVADENDIVIEETVLKPVDTSQPATLILSPLILNSKPLNGTLGRSAAGKDTVDEGEEKIFMLSANV